MRTCCSSIPNAVEPTEEVMRQRTVGLYSTQGKCYRLRLKEPQRDYYAAQTILLAKQENVGAMVGDLGHYVSNDKLYHISYQAFCAFFSLNTIANSTAIANA